MTDVPDDITALIAATLVRAHAAPKATPEQLASRTADFLPTATQVRDALHAAGYLRHGEEIGIARRALDAEHLRRMMQDTLERMTVAERERWLETGRAQGRLEVVRGKSGD